MNSYNRPQETMPYVIKAGDTLYKLAMEFNTTIDKIIQYNPYMNPNYLIVGEKMYVPTESVHAPCPGGNYHIIRSGDTLYKLAQEYNVSIESIIEANPGINPNMLIIGKVICIPIGPKEECPPGSTPYKIKKGDTLYQISKKHRIPLNDLLKANPTVDPYNLQVGQKICIPNYWSTFQSELFKVEFLYPSDWSMVRENYYEGPSGYFSVSAIDSDSSLIDVCKEEAYQPILQYGSKPNISSIKVDGQEGYITIPSEDQRIEMDNQAGLIIKYPNPIKINDAEFNYLIIWVEKQYATIVQQSLKFIQ